MDHQDSAGKRWRMGARAAVVAALVVVVAALAVLRPWRGIEPGVALVAACAGIVFVGGSLLLLRRVGGREDWYQARVRTSWSSPDDEPRNLSSDAPATVTVVCTDLFARGRFQSFAQHLMRVLAALDGTPVLGVRVEPLGKENVVHVDTTHAGMHVVFRGRAERARGPRDEPRGAAVLAAGRGRGLR